MRWSNRVAWSLLAGLVLVAGCRDDDVPGGDTGRPEADADVGGDTDVPRPDADGDADAEPDVDADVGPEADVDVVPDGTTDGEFDGGVDVHSGSTPAPPAEVLRTGTAGVVLRGVVLAPDRVLDPGEVFVAGDGSIACVAEDCAGTAGASTATLIDTHGVISPGLIDAHNHLAYNFLPEWIPDPPRLFENRYQWAEDPQYEAHIRPYAAHRSTGTHYCPAAKWGELRSLFHGTTTVQGQSFEQSCVNWGVRNADHFHGLGHDHMRTTIASVRDITDSEATDYVASFAAATNPTTRFAVHMTEGYASDHVLEEFDSFAGRDPRANRHAGTSLLIPPTSLLIHCMTMTPAQIEEARATQASIVWSPSSNWVLYGRTAPIAEFLATDGLTVAIAPDWTPSGEDEMLSELRFGWAYGRATGIAALTTERLWRMGTSEAAVAVGLDHRIGRLEAGLVGDVAVFGRQGADPYGAVLDSRAADVRLVLLGGRGMYGDAGLQAATAANAYCEAFDACGTPKYACVQESPTAPDRRNETLGDIRTQLYNILEGIGYPADEQYHRGDELLELLDCTR
ncbi:MAG: amidohydrolase family protein [Deltaproteobacteria bacterium]|nr:amidohydrolase family protein [Deltaproteobacteria bacterium]